jgi:hypothetical protein
VLTWPDGTSVATVAAAATPPSAVLAIWSFDAAQGRFVGFAPQAPQASDLTTVNRHDAVFICVQALGTLNRPAI